MIRAFDIIVSLIGMALTLPLYPLIALLIKLDSPGPVFYRQARIGLDGEQFKIIKFRTMVSNADSKGAITTKGDVRVTRVGKWLRSTELDEVPTLLNVLKGDMSIVGPRPEVPEYVALYTPEQRRILSVRPGMTGVSTILYRNESEFLRDGEDYHSVYVNQIMPEKIRLSLEYLNRRTLLSDLTVISNTLLLVVRQRKG